MRISPNLEFQSNLDLVNYPSTSLGSRIVIIAEAEDGPLYEPLFVYNLYQIKKILKSGPLLDLCEDVFHIIESPDIVLVRIERKEFDLAYRCLELLNFDLVYIDEFEFGKSEEEVYNFIELAKRKEQQGMIIHGFFDVKVEELGHEINEILKKLFFEDVIDTYELGKYISLVANQVLNRNSAMIYAALVASLDAGINPVNKKVDIDLVKEYRKEEILKLETLGVVTFRKNFKEEVVCASSTCAVQTPKSTYKNITNFRIVQYFIQEIRDELQEKIGQSSSETQMDKIKTILNKQLDEYLQRSIIKGGRYNILISPVKGEIFINIEIVPIFSVTSITAQSQVRIYK